MHEEKKLKDIINPSIPKTITVNNVDLLDYDPKHHKGSGLKPNEVPFINNSEKEDNAIFSH